jgi:hypothetical protein
MYKLTNAENKCQRMTIRFGKIGAEIEMSGSDDMVQDSDAVFVRH